MELEGIDTHSLFKQFEAAGFTSTQAEATVDAFKRVVQYNLVTKQDLAKFELATQQNFSEVQKQMKEMDVRLMQQIKEVDGRLTQKITELELTFKATLAETKADLVKWMMGGFFLMISAMTVLKLFV